MIFPTVVGELVLGWLTADLITGAFHWWEDRYGRLETPFIGPFIVAPNRLHHAEPLAFTKHGFWARNGASMVTAAVAGGLLWAAFGLSFWLAALVLGGGLTNEVHRFAHQPSKAPAWVKMLQRTGLLQSPKEHAAHHRPPQDVNFCVLTDWLNPGLEMVGFWRRIERLIPVPVNP